MNIISKEKLINIKRFIKDIRNVYVTTAIIDFAVLCYLIKKLNAIFMKMIEYIQQNIKEKIKLRIE
ncbi:hypothetical protein [Brachyspira hyodysenteriae]|uniref:hypothetical protein n=1 Tax=Brachyspira hyodysenteriae TaxID=159 RepID=UPI0022CE115B|nr:hypothetical protein [Brachyspira hyodysenteriae]MCZ9889678.1 hypothetical protein [Brachyspira hyodysenteriae]